MRRAGRVDGNQREIVLGLRSIGATVLVISSLPNCFDILVGFQGVNYIMELKDPNQPKSKQRLTDGEQKFKDEWRGGEYYVVTSLGQAVEIITNNK